MPVSRATCSNVGSRAVAAHGCCKMPCKTANAGALIVEIAPHDIQVRLSNQLSVMLAGICSGAVHVHLNMTCSALTPCRVSPDLQILHCMITIVSATVLA